MVCVRLVALGALEHKRYPNTDPHNRARTVWAVGNRVFATRLPTGGRLVHCVNELAPAEFAASYRLAAAELTLPCDQRYTVADMQRVAKIVLREAGI